MSHSTIDPSKQGFDPDFANRGMFYEFAQGSSPMKILGRTTGGKILLAGSALPEVAGKPLSQFQLVQLLEDGTPDPDFGTSGFVVGGFKENHHAYTDGANLLKDGKILLIGTHWGALNQLAFARFLADGSLDQTFGDGGVYITPIPSASGAPPTTRQSSRNALSLPTAIGPNGEIITASGLRVRRYTSDGKEDMRFDTQLRSINAVGVSATGKITVAGVNRQRQGVIARFKANGTPDNTFGDNGYLAFSVFKGRDAGTVVNCMVLRDDDSIFVAGIADPDIFTPDGATERGMLAAFNSNGSPNLVFNDGKPVVTELPSGQSCRWKDIYHSLPDRLVVVGSTGTHGSESSLIARYKTSGETDSSFGNNGHRVTDISSDREEWLSVLVQPNNKILVSGDCTIKTDPATVVRYQET